jgi:hypothetical protein
LAGAHVEEVDDGGGTKGGVGCEEGEEEVVEDRGEEGGGAELVGEVEGEGAEQGTGGRASCAWRKEASAGSVYASRRPSALIRIHI